MLCVWHARKNCSNICKDTNPENIESNDNLKIRELQYFESRWNIQDDAKDWLRALQRFH